MSSSTTDVECRVQEEIIGLLVTFNRENQVRLEVVRLTLGSWAECGAVSDLVPRLPGCRPHLVFALRKAAI